MKLAQAVNEAASKFNQSQLTAIRSTLATGDTADADAVFSALKAIGTRTRGIRAAVLAMFLRWFVRMGMDATGTSEEQFKDFKALVAWYRNTLKAEVAVGQGRERTDTPDGWGTLAPYFSKAVRLLEALGTAGAPTWEEVCAAAGAEPDGITLTGSKPVGNFDALYKQATAAMKGKPDGANKVQVDVVSGSLATIIKGFEQRANAQHDVLTLMAAILGVAQEDLITIAAIANVEGFDAIAAEDNASETEEEEEAAEVATVS